MESLSGHSLNADEGVFHGSPNSQIKGATVCWMATPDAIEATAAAGHSLVIGHESLFLPYNFQTDPNLPEGWKDWPFNRQRVGLLDKHDLSFMRLHGSVDDICIFDVFAAELGLGAPDFVDGLVKVYEIAECTLAELVERVKRCFSMPTLRVSVPSDMQSKVRRVGLPWGGLGLFVNVKYQQRLVEQDCDVFIAGEADNYGFRFAAESGIPMIETSHEISENPGLRRFTDILSEAFPETIFSYYENDCIWQTI